MTTKFNNNATESKAPLASHTPHKTLSLIKPLYSNGRVEVRQSTIPGAGRGLFASIKIKRGQPITDYGGVICTTAPKDCEYVVQMAAGSFLNGNVETKSMGPKYDKFGRFANQLRKENMVKFPNLKRNASLIVSTRNRTVRLAASCTIQAGAEIFLAYSRGHIKA